MKETWTRIISIILIVVVFRFAGGMMGGYMARQNTQQGMDELLQASKEYISGTCTSTKYDSNFWNINFQTSENWQMYSAEELEEMNKTLKKGSKANSIEYFENNGIKYDEQTVEDMHDIMLNQYEMGALYYQNEEVVGEVTMQVADAMGYSFDEWMDMFFNTSTLKSMGNVSMSEQIIAGEKYKTIKAEYVYDGMGMTSYVFLRYKDGIVCTLNCKYSSNYEEVLNSFLTQTSANN
ncbi:MAG: hypothetical protein IKJ17_00605 [Clostridia bacterium]|nr:hypothetical protein [Clostridia bacterium]